MRLATLLVRGQPRAAAFTDDRYIDLHATDPGLPATVRQLLAAGPDALRAADRAARRADAVAYPAADARLAPPVPDPAKIVCLGLNYRDHARESGQAIPDEPVLFSKFASALTGHGAPVVLPKVSAKVDYEAE